VRLYFAGADGTEKYNQALFTGGVKYRLVSAYTLGYDREVPDWPFKSTMIDSGGYSARTRGVEIEVEEYVDFLNRNQPDMALELDTSDVWQTLANRKILQAKCPSVYIIPIYHWSDYISSTFRSMIDDLVTDYPMIAVGGVAGVSIGREEQFELYDYVFQRTRDKVKVHGLGQTSKPYLEKYPFYSVDSTSWLAAVRYGCSMVDGAWKEMTKLQAKLYRGQEALQKRIPPEIRHYLKLEDYFTRLWGKRGVVWT